MDRHVRWLRRRIIASIATQTAEVFALVAVVAFALMYWRTDQGPLTALFGSVVVAQLVAGARLGHAMRNNPLNYLFMRRYVERPFSYSVSRFQGEDDAHPVAEKLPGFAPVATIRDHGADPEPIFDVYHDPSRLVAASISRASGSVSLISSLADGRILVTDARAIPPNERLVMAIADDDSIDSVIATHRRALSARTDVVELLSSAHQVVLDSLAVEYESYLALGPALSPFLDLEASGRSWVRLIARIKPEELTDLPVRLGPDVPLPVRRIAEPTAAPSEPESNAEVAPAAPEVIAPQIIVEAPRGDRALVAPTIEVPGAIAHLTVPEVNTPDIVAPDVVAPVVATPEVAEVAVTEVPLATPTEIAPHPFVTVEPDTADLATEGEPITAEVPIVDVMQALADIEHPGLVSTPAVMATATTQDAPLDLAAALASLSAVDSIDTEAPAVVEPVREPAMVEAVAPEVVVEPVREPAMVEAPAPEVVVEPVREPAMVEAVAPEVVVEPTVDEHLISQLAPAPELDSVAAPAAPWLKPTSQTPTSTPLPTGQPVAPWLHRSVDSQGGSGDDAPVPAAVPVDVAPVAADVVAVPAADVAPVPAAVPVDVAPVAADVVAVPAADVAPAPAAVPVDVAPVGEVGLSPDPAVVLAEVFAPAPTATPPAHTPPPTPPAYTPPAPTAEPLPAFILQAPAATLAEAVGTAPDTPAALAHTTDNEPMLVPTLDAALGRTEELSPTRPRLSAVIRANAAPTAGGVPPKRNRRKAR